MASQWLVACLYVSPHPCLQRIELQPLAAVESERDQPGLLHVYSDPLLYACCVVRGCLLYATLGHTFAGQMLGSNGGSAPKNEPTHVLVLVQHHSAGEQPPSVWICFPFFPSPPPPHHRVDEKPLEIVSILASLFSYPPSHPRSRRHCTPSFSPLSCLSRPRVARHETFLRASVGVLTVPGFPFSSNSPPPRQLSFLLFATRPDDDHWLFLTTRGQPSHQTPKRIEP